MATPVETPEPSPKQGIAPNLEFFSRAIASSLVVMYGIGYVIIAVYEAQYGVPDVNPLRAKILLVGFVFCCFVVLPAAAYLFGLSHYFGFEPLEASDHKHRRYRQLIELAGFGFTACFMAAVTSWLFIPQQGTAYPKWWGIGFGLAFGFSFLAFRCISRRFAQQPGRCVVLAILTVVLLLVAGFSFAAEISAKLMMWFFMMAWFTWLFAESKNKLREALDYRNWIFIFVVQIWYYVSQLYGYLPPHLGGGAPTQAIMYVKSRTAWMDANSPNPVSLVGGSDEGYYVLVPGKNKALYIPRDAVASVYFGPSSDLPDTTKELPSKSKSQ